MSTPTLIALVILAALVLALALARKAVASLIAFNKMDRHAQDATIEKARFDARSWSRRHDKISIDLIFAGVFLLLTCLCAWCGLYYTCGYAFLQATLMLGQGIRNQIRLFILNHQNPNVVELSTIDVFETA